MLAGGGSSVLDPILRAVKAAIDGEAAQASVYAKSKEVIRLMDLKLPDLRRAEACRQVLAVDLACRVLNIQPNKANLMKQVPADAKDYQQALVKCKNVLMAQPGLGITQVGGSSNNNDNSMTTSSSSSSTGMGGISNGMGGFELGMATSTMEVLAIRFGVSLKPLALKNLEEYKRIQTNRSDKGIITDKANLTTSVYQAAAYFVASKMKGVKIDKARVVQIAEVDINLFNTVVKSMSEKLMSTKPKNPPPIRKEQSGNDKENPVGVHKTAGGGNMLKGNLVIHRSSFTSIRPLTERIFPMKCGNSNNNSSNSNDSACETTIKTSTHLMPGTQSSSVPVPSSTVDPTSSENIVQSQTQSEAQSQLSINRNDDAVKRRCLTLNPEDLRSKRLLALGVPMQSSASISDQKKKIEEEQQVKAKLEREQYEMWKELKKRKRQEGEIITAT